MSDLLTAELIAKLSSKYWRARKRVDGSLAGRHTTPHHGQALEFSQHRQYTHGDEINWKLFGRKEKFFVKQFQAETNLRAQIVFDASNSMSFYSKGNPPKIDYAKRLAAATAYVFVKQNDALGAAMAKDGTFNFIPQKSGWEHFNIIISGLEEVEPKGAGNLPELLQNLALRLRKRSLVILISDLLEDSQKIIYSLKYLNSCHHDCTVIQILDEAEIEFPFGENNLFIDLETGTKIKGFWNIRKDYKKIMRGLLEEYKLSFRKSGIEYHLVTTNIPLDRSLSMVLQ